MGIISRFLIWRRKANAGRRKNYPRLLVVESVITVLGILVALSMAKGRLAEAAVCDGVASGAWTNSATWTGCTGAGGLPDPLDTVVIHAGVTVTLNTTATIAGLGFASGASPAILTFDSSNPTLTVNGTVDIGQPTAAATNAWNINGGTATVSGLITYSGATADATEIAKTALTTGTLNANGGLTFVASANGSKVLDMSGGAGQLNLKGALTMPATAGTFTLGTTSNFNYADSSAQTITMPPSGKYNNLLVNNSTGATLGSAVTTSNVGGNIIVQSGTLKNGGLAMAGNASATLEVDNAAAFEMSGSSVFPTGFSTFTFQGTSTERYLQTSASVISAQTYGNLDAKPAANTITFTFQAGSPTVAGNLTVGNGTNTAAVVTAATNATTLSVTGTVTISASTTLTANASNTLTVGGSWSNAGTFTHSSGTVTFNATASGKTIAAGSSSFNKCVFNGSGGTWATQTNSFNCASTLTVTTGELDLGAVGTTITSTTLIDTGGTLKFTSASGAKSFTGAVTVNSGGTWNNNSFSPLTTFGGGIASNGALFAMGGNVTMNATEGLSGSTAMSFGGTFAISGAVTVTNTNTGGVTITGATTGSLAGSTFTNSTNALVKFGSSVLTTGNGGVLNASATGNTVDYNGSVAQTIKTPSGAPATYYNLTVESSGSFAVMAAAFTVSNNLNILTGTLTDAGFQLTGPGSGSGTLTIAAAASFCLGATGNSCSASNTVATTWPTFQTYALDTTSSVKYVANADQTVANAPTYGNLLLQPIITANRVYTFGSGSAAVNGNFTVQTTAAANSLTVNLGGDLTVAAAKTTALNTTSNSTETLVTRPGSTDYNFSTGGLTIASKAKIDATGSSSTITIQGNYTNNGTFTAGHSAVLLSGSAQQTLTTGLTGANAFYDLLISNSSGTSASDCERTAFVPSVIFASAATVTDTFSVTTPLVRVQFLSGATYTFTNVNWNGQLATTKLVFRNSATSGTWLLVVSGTISVANLDVSRSDASGGSLITTTGNGTTGCTNTNWNLAAPNSPTSLNQLDGVTPIAIGGWTTNATIAFNAQASDTDAVDTLSFCVEGAPLGQAFTNTETACGSSSAYSGSPLALAVSLALAPNRQYHWQARLKDRGGLYSAWASFGGNAEAAADFGIDQTGPAGPTNLASSDHSLSVWSNDNTLTVGWTAATDNGVGLAGYSTLFDTSSGTIAPTSQNTGLVTTVDSSAVADSNSVYFHIRPVDALGNWGTTVQLGPFYIDTTAPAGPTNLTSSDHSLSVWSSDNTITMTWTAATDAGSGLSGYSYLFDTSSTTVPAQSQNSGAVTTVSSSPLADGNSIYFHVRAVDAVGNWGATVHLGPFYVDTTAPGTASDLTSTSDTPTTWSSQNVISAVWTAATDTGSGLAGYSYVFDTTAATVPSAVQNLADLTTVNSSALADGNNWYFHLRAQDHVGNWGAAVAIGPFYIDTTAPTAASQPTTASPTSTVQPTWTWTAASDAASGLAATTLVEWSNQADLSGATQATISSTATSFTQPSALAEGTWYLRLTNLDTAGNSAVSPIGSVVISGEAAPKTKAPSLDKPLITPPALLVPAPTTSHRAAVKKTSQLSMLVQSAVGAWTVSAAAVLLLLGIILIAIILIRRDQSTD